MAWIMYKPVGSFQNTPEAQNYLVLVRGLRIVRSIHIEADTRLYKLTHHKSVFVFIRACLQLRAFVKLNPRPKVTKTVCSMCSK